MAVFGKRSGGTGVLEAPEDIYAQQEWKTPEPAPAGMLQRKPLADEAEYAVPIEAEEEPYKAKRDSLRYKLKLGIPRSIAGKILGATLLLMFAGAIVGSCLALRSLLMHDSRFAIATSSAIEIQGMQHLNRDQVLSVFGADLERNIFKVPLAQRRADLEKLPWVKQATVMRLLPNTIRIAVTERTPVAFVRNSNQIGLVDADGVLLDMPQDVAGDPKYSFPVLTGLAPTDPDSVRKARMEIYEKFMADLDRQSKPGSTRPSESISEIDLSNPEDVKALVSSGGSDILVHFGDENFLKRYQLFEQNLPTWKAQYAKLASVDTRYENQVVLEMQPGTQVPVNGPAADSSSPSQPTTAQAKAINVAKPTAKSAPAKSVVVKAPAKASTKPAKKPAKAVAKPGKVTMSKQKIEAMLAAARSKPSAHGGRQ